MGKLIEMETEKKIFSDVYEFLKERGMIPELMVRTGASRNTVMSTFADEFGKLKGKRLLIFKEAVKMAEEINELKNRAEEALGK